MTEAQEIELVRAFVQRYAGIGLFSTGAKLVDYAKDLYNVSGSTDDPKEVAEYKGMAWKKLLVRLAGLADANCYVTNEIPDQQSNHPAFAVGGHMTPNSDGIVDVGKVSYLMPLCKWHNSTGRDGVAFEHAEIRMLQLKGFMEGDSAVTFAARLPSDMPYSLLYFDRGEGGWEEKKLSGEKALGFNDNALAAAVGDAEPGGAFVLLERRGDLFFVANTNL